MKQKELSPLNSDRAKELATNWQLCRNEAIPALFEAYNAERLQTERVTTFVLEQAQMEEIIKLSRKVKRNVRFLILLASKTKNTDGTVPESPEFVPIVQIRGDETEMFDNCFVPNWVKNPIFPVTPQESPDSGAEAIPAAAAYLFVHKWLETDYDDIADVFTANAYNLRKRAIGFRFGSKESEAILAEMKKKVATGSGKLCVHLGSGITVSVHPYAFRPVLEVLATKDMDKTVLMNDDEDGDFYDFSHPIPPN